MMNRKLFYCVFAKRSSTVLLALLLSIFVLFNLAYLHFNALKNHSTKKRFERAAVIGDMKQSSSFISTNRIAGKILPSQYLLQKHQQKITNRFLNEPLIDSKQKEFFMIVFIKSACARVANRQRIRTTYASIHSINGRRFAFIFLIGTSTTGCQNNIEEEVTKFGDILQPDVADEYSALPDKVLSAYQWIYYNIKNIAAFYSFTDDDCIINILNIYKYFENNFSTLSKKNKIYCGFHLANEAIPERNIDSKYYSSPEVYSKPSYPAFCNGGLTTITYSMLEEIYLMAEKTDRNGFTLEDVYVTGILRSKLQSAPSNIAELKSTPTTKYHEFMLHLGQNPNAQLAQTIFWSNQLQRLLIETDTKFRI